MMISIWIGLNLIPFLSLLIVKHLLPLQYKKKNYAICIFYYYFNVNILYYYFSTPPYERILDTTTVNGVSDIITYTIIFEGVFYIWHRFSHFPSVYRYLHAHHHVNYHIGPIDFIDVDYIDSLGFHVCMHLPLTIVPLYSITYLGWYFVIFTSGFLLHSDLLGEHHRLHHQYFHCNYSYLIPVFDYAFGTIRS